MWKTIFPVAFTVVESQNLDTWSWFLVQTHDVIIVIEHDFVIISDKERGLMDVVPLVSHDAHNNYCLRHLAQNLYGDTSDNLARK